MGEYRSRQGQKLVETSETRADRPGGHARNRDSGRHASAVTRSTVVRGSSNSSTGKPRRQGLERGACVGRYIIVERHGGGGMGDVYRAFDPDLNREIALKLVPAEEGADPSAGAMLRERLLREAQGLARLSHPNVVAVHDVGVVDNAVFLAMEMVEGDNLRSWLETPRPRRKVLEVFLAAGAGLQAAHAAGLVHRDFKPANVIVGDDGRVRVVDFGLVRSLEQEQRPALTAETVPDHDALAESRSAVTRTAGSGESHLSATPPSSRPCGDLLDHNITEMGMAPGTPAYMAPEQHYDLAVSEAADQYSFAVSLYEALYGERPFEGRSQRDIAGAIRMRRFSEPGDGRVPARLRRILLRALAFLPANRYPSMNELLSDLARDPAARWRRAAVGVGTAACVGLAALGLHASAMAGPTCDNGAQQLRASLGPDVRAAVRASIEKGTQTHAAHTASQVDAALERYASAWVESYADTCRATHVRGDQSPDLLDRRMACLDERRGSAGALAATLRAVEPDTAVAKALTAIGSLAPVGDCNDREALMARTPLPADPRIRREVETRQRELQEAKALITVAKYDEAESALREIQKASASLNYAPLDAQVGFRLGEVRRLLGQHEEARQLFTSAIVRAAEGRAFDTHASAWISLLWAVGEGQNKFDEALTLADLAAVAPHLDRGRPSTAARFHSTRGLVYFRLARYEEARSDFEQAHAQFVEALGPDHWQVATTHNRIGLAMWRTGDLDGAEAHYRQALAIFEKALGASHPDVSVAHTNLGNINWRRENYEKAREHHTKALELLQDSLGADHHRVGNPLNDLGVVAGAQGDLEAARDYHRRALEIREKALGADHTLVGVSLSNLGRIEVKLGHPGAAYELQARALTIFAKVFGDDHVHTASALETLGEIARKQKRAEVAIDHYSRALEIRRGTPDGTLAPVVALSNLAELERERGRSGRALALQDEALALARGKDHGIYAQLVVEKAQTLAGLPGRGGDAVTLVTGARQGLPDDAPAEAHETLTAWLHDNNAVVAGR